MNIVSQITGVFDTVGAWLVSAVQGMVPLFYDSADGLTLLGTLSIIGLSVSLSFLLIGVVQKWLRFR